MAHHQTQGATYPTKHRRNHPRSKNGCLTCRGRRKKCDETKPNCNFCVKSAQICVWRTEDNTQKQESQNGSPSSTNSERSPSEQQCQAQMVDKSGVTNLALVCMILLYANDAIISHLKLIGFSSQRPQILRSLNDSSSIGAPMEIYHQDLLWLGLEISPTYTPTPVWTASYISQLTL